MSYFPTFDGHFCCCWQSGVDARVPAAIPAARWVLGIPQPAQRDEEVEQKV